jgi:hypothetical protein
MSTIRDLNAGYFVLLEELPGQIRVKIGRMTHGVVTFVDTTKCMAKGSFEFECTIGKAGHDRTAVSMGTATSSSELERYLVNCGVPSAYWAYEATLKTPAGV